MISNFPGSNLELSVVGAVDISCSAIRVNTTSSPLFSEVGTPLATRD